MAAVAVRLTANAVWHGQRCALSTMSVARAVGIECRRAGGGEGDGGARARCGGCKDTPYIHLWGWEKGMNTQRPGDLGEQCVSSCVKER